MLLVLYSCHSPIELERSQVVGFQVFLPPEVRSIMHERTLGHASPPCCQPDELVHMQVDRSALGVRLIWNRICLYVGTEATPFRRCAISEHILHFFLFPSDFGTYTLPSFPFNDYCRIELNILYQNSSLCGPHMVFAFNLLLISPTSLSRWQNVPNSCTFLAYRSMD